METRRYAKRQRTWFRRDERVKWFYPDACSPNGLIQDVLDYIREQAPEL
jgi:tRNA A37 N6-isopentenylltransferase MiaA